MIKTLDKYIFTQLIGPFLFGFFLFVTIIAIDPLMSALQALVNDNTSFILIFRWFLNRLPQDMIFTFPMSVLLSTLLVFGRMSKDSETIAMKAGGINFFRIILPVMAFAFMVTVISFIFNETVVPGSNERARKIRRQEILKLIENDTTENSIMRTSDGAFAYARKVIEKRGYMEKVLFEYYDDNGDLKKRISAATADWDGSAWVLKNVVLQEYTNTASNTLAAVETVAATASDSTAESVQPRPAPVIPVNMPELRVPEIKDTPAEFARETKKPTEMSYSELKTRIESYERAQFMDTTELRVGLAMKTSLPFASLFFAVIGAAFGLTNNRSGAFIGFGLSMIIIFTYYVLMSVFTSLGKSGVISPMLAAWMQNIIFAVVGFYIVKNINE